MLGERLKKLRVGAGLTQSQLARQLGISASAVGMYEQNRREPSHELLRRLCELFDVSADWLLAGGEETLSCGKQLPANRDLDGVLEGLKRQLQKQEGLMFNGKILDDYDIEVIFDAMRLGAQIAASKNMGKKHEEETSGTCGLPVDTGDRLE